MICIYSQSKRQENGALSGNKSISIQEILEAEVVGVESGDSRAARSDSSTRRGGAGWRWECRGCTERARSSQELIRDLGRTDDGEGLGIRENFWGGCRIRLLLPGPGYVYMHACVYVHMLTHVHASTHTFLGPGYRHSSVRTQQGSGPQLVRY